MRKLTTLGRLFVAIAMVAFGVQHFIYLGFVTRVFPELPQWIPGHRVLACVFGGFLIVGGAAIVAGINARTIALLLGGAILLSFATLHLPLVLANPVSGGLWTNAGKAAALAGACFLIGGVAYRTNDFSMGCASAHSKSGSHPAGFE